MISASTVSASKFEILSESEDYEKIVALADEIVSVTNGGPVEDPFEQGIRVSDIDFDNALKEYIDTPLLTSELLSVSEVESALEQSDYIWIIPIRAYGHLYEACAVRANGEDGQPIDQWHISGARGYESDDTPTYIEQLNISLAVNPDIVWDNYKFRLVGGVDPIRFPVWIALNETQVEYLIPGREDAAATAFAVSIELPPPTARIKSACISTAFFTPSSARASLGFGFTPPSSSKARPSFARDASTRSRRPLRFALPPP